MLVTVVGISEIVAPFVRERAGNGLGTGPSLSPEATAASTGISAAVAIVRLWCKRIGRKYPDRESRPNSAQAPLKAKISRC